MDVPTPTPAAVPAATTLPSVEPSATEIDRRIALEQIAALRKGLPNVRRSGFVTIVGFGAIAYPVCEPWALWSWVACMLLVEGPLLQLAIRLMSDAQVALRGPERTLRLYTYLVALGTLPMSLSVWWILPPDILYQMTFAAFIFAQLTGVPVNLGYMPSMVANLVVVLVPLAARLLTLGSTLGVIAGVATLVVVPLLLSLLRSTAAQIRENYRIRFSYEALSAERLRQAEVEAQARRATEHALAEAQRLSAEKSRFLAAASHDLRQPVHAIGLFTTALAASELSPRVRGLADGLERSLQGLNELLNRLFDLARIDSGAVVAHPSVVPVEALFARLKAQYAPVAAARGLRLRVAAGAGLAVRTDEVLMAELLGNLLSNACRYTERGGVLLCARRRGDRVALQVWDTGRGIAPESHEAIFDEFVQLDNPARDRRQGIGLGLAIVRRIATLLDVACRVASRPGRGSTFEVVVERAPSPAGTPAPAHVVPSDAPDVAGAMVLLVDDENAILESMQAALQAWGCTVLVARDAAEAVHRIAIADRYPDLLITDHRLGGRQTSEDVVRAVQSVVEGGLPVLVISGEIGAELASDVSARGWTFLRKPVDGPTLRGLIARAAAQPAERAGGETEPGAPEATAARCDWTTEGGFSSGAASATAPSSSFASAPTSPSTSAPAASFSVTPTPTHTPTATHAPTHAPTHTPTHAPAPAPSRDPAAGPEARRCES